LGSAWAEIDDFVTPMEFLVALGTGTVHGHHWDVPRAWSPRSVPSTS
jgi:hypothetical protein